jgi:hypothetical protein
LICAPYHIFIIGDIHEEERSTYKFLVEKPGGERPVAGSKHRLEDNIKMGLSGMGWEHA